MIRKNNLTYRTDANAQIHDDKLKIQELEAELKKIKADLEMEKDIKHDYQVWLKTDEKPCKASHAYDLTIRLAMSIINSENIGYYKKLIKVANILRESYYSNHKDCYSPEYLACLESQEAEWYGGDKN